MKSVILSLVIFLGFQTAMAESLHPCTPTQTARSIQMSCHNDEYIYSINIKRLVSRDLEICQGLELREYRTAHVEVSERSSGSKVAKLEVFNGEFFVQLGLETSRFSSKALNLDLRNCVTPQDGGFSIGN